MGLDKAVKDPIVQDYRINEADTGSTDIQVAIISKRINVLTEHLRKHIHDESTRRGLRRLVGRRRRLLQYLNENDVGRYRSLIARLGLRR